MILIDGIACSRTFESVYKTFNQKSFSSDFMSFAHALQIYYYLNLSMTGKQCLLSAEASANQKGAIANALISGRTVRRGHILLGDGRNKVPAMTAFDWDYAPSTACSGELWWFLPHSSITYNHLF